jgi:hypothetical protein
MISRPTRTGRAALALVPQPAPARDAPHVTFCSHCGEHPGAETTSRVCESCGLGLLLRARADTAPAFGDAFVVLDSSLSVCAVSAAAEELLATREIDAVNCHITQLLVPADAEAQGVESVAAAVMWAARGEYGPRPAMVRPATTFGIRLHARIAHCGPPHAAVVVFG